MATPESKAGSRLGAGNILAMVEAIGEKGSSGQMGNKKTKKGSIRLQSSLEG